MTQQPEPTVNTDVDFCPSCGFEWAYLIDGKRFSHLIAIVDPAQDRVVEWMCPKCEKRWER